MFFVKSISLLGAVSLASISAASAGDMSSVVQDDLFGSGVLDLEETPMSVAELGEARGGFSFGGMKFNISVDIAPLQIAPLFPNGVFGDSAGPLPNGVFGNSNENSNNNAPSANDTASQNYVPAPVVSVPEAIAAAATNNPPAAPAGSEALSDAAAQAATSAAAAMPTNVPASPAPVAAASIPQATNNDAVSQSVSPVSSTPAQQAISGATNSPAVTELSLPGSQPPPPEDAVEIVDGVYFSPSTGEVSNPGGLPIDVQVVENGAGQSGNSSQPNTGQEYTPPTTAAPSSKQPASDDASLSAVLTEMPEKPEVYQQFGQNGVTTTVNNTLNNVLLTQSVRLNVEVQNYSFVTGLTRATNLTSQAVTQSFFLRGLN